MRIAGNNLYRRLSTIFGQMMVKKIGTHDGKFHADEALACFMLKQLPEYKDAQVVRLCNLLLGLKNLSQNCI